MPCAEAKDYVISSVLINVYDLMAAQSFKTILEWNSSKSIFELSLDLHLHLLNLLSKLHFFVFKLHSKMPDFKKVGICLKELLSA